MMIGVKVHLILVPYWKASEKHKQRKGTSDHGKCLKKTDDIDKNKLKHKQ